MPKSRPAKRLGIGAAISANQLEMRNCCVAQLFGFGLNPSKLL
jgi:hypothetical protein